MKSTHRVVGVDESGKGDFFGPLVIAAFAADDSDLVLLRAAGVRDGKLISENRIKELDESLREDFPHEVLVISPEQYNSQYKKIRNLNKLLADGHAEVIDRLLQNHKADLVVSDKFGKPELIENALASRRRVVNLKQIVKGESVLQVAAASIIARARFVREMEELADQYGSDLPRGASSKVDEAGRVLIKHYGVEVLEKTAKIHFKNYHRVTNPTLF